MLDLATPLPRCGAQALQCAAAADHAAAHPRPALAVRGGAVGQRGRGRGGEPVSAVAPVVYVEGVRTARQLQALGYPVAPHLEPVQRMRIDPRVTDAIRNPDPSALLALGEPAADDQAAQRRAALATRRGRLTALLAAVAGAWATLTALGVP